MDAAIEYYRPVAEGQGEIAQAAQRKLVRLDLERNPGQYIRVGCYADSYGNLVVAVVTVVTVLVLTDRPVAVLFTVLTAIDSAAARPTMKLIVAETLSSSVPLNSVCSAIEVISSRSWVNSELM